MAEKINKNDFIEIEFTGRVANTNEIFDTNIKEDAEKEGLKLQQEPKPFILSVGNKMLPQGLDEDLLEKELQKEHEVELNPEKAFGKRDPKQVRMVPLKHFHEQNINPQRGMKLNLDGKIARVLSSSGGRVLIDLNNPLAGKKVKYKYKINRKVTDINEKINALQDFLFRQTFPFELDEKNKKLILETPKEMAQFATIMSKPFEEILGLKVEAKENKESNKDKEKSDSEKPKEPVEDKKSANNT